MKLIDSPPRFLLCCFVDCCLMRQYLSACLFIRLPRYSFGLAASPPHSDIPSALRPRPLTEIFLRPCGLAPHGDIPSALRPRPLTAIFLWPCGLAPSRQYSFGLAASPPHGKIDFLFASRQMSIFYSPHGECQF